MKPDHDTRVRSLPTAGEFRRRLVVGTLLLSLMTVGFISIYLVTLLDFSSAEWRHFGLMIAGLFPIMFGLVIWINSRLLEQAEALREGVRRFVIEG